MNYIIIYIKYIEYYYNETWRVGVVGDYNNHKLKHRNHNRE